MKRRIALDIKKKILALLKNNEISVRELETKVNTNHLTLKTQLNELEFFGLIEKVKHNRNDKNGKPYTSIKLTNRGKELLN